jgi:hypothetical protein
LWYDDLVYGIFNKKNLIIKRLSGLGICISILTKQF